MDIFEQKNLLPMLITKRVEPFNDPAYIFELKFDGIRCIAYLDDHCTELRNKQNKGLLTRFPEMADIHTAAKKRCILDGELFAIRELPHLVAPPLTVPLGNEKAVWVEPRLICTVQYMEITSGGSMRQAVLKGIRDNQ